MRVYGKIGSNFSNGKVGFVPELPIGPLTPTHISYLRTLIPLIAHSNHPQEASHGQVRNTNALMIMLQQIR